MVKNVGIITEIENGIARVAVGCGIQCEGCGCGLSRVSKSITMRASTGSLAVRKGDSVVIATREANVVRDGILVFGLPLALAFAGFQLGAGFMSRQAGIALGIVLPLLPIAYLLLRKRKPELFIERVITESERIL